MEVDRARTAELKDALHRTCGPTVLVLPTVQVPSRLHPCRWPPGGSRDCCVGVSACQLRVSAVQAEAIARKNDLSVIDLLRPFANVDTSNVAINTTREQVRACALAYFRALAGTRALARARRPAYE